MSEPVISLKSSCQCRFLCQVSPSESQRVFTLGDFSSPSFLDSHFFSSKTTISSKGGNLCVKSIQDVIHKVNQTFMQIHKQVDVLHVGLIQKIVAFLSMEDRNEDAKHLEHMIRKLHLKACHNNYNPKLIDELVKLLSEYHNAIATTKRPNDVHTNMVEVSKMLEQLTKDVDKFLNSKLEMALKHIPSRQVFDTNSSYDFSEECGRHQALETLRNKYSDILISKGEFVSTRGGNYSLILEVHTPEWGSHDQYRMFANMINLSKQNLLFSTKLNYYDLSYEAYSSKQTIHYLKSLNLIIGLSGDSKRLSIYKLSHNGLKKVVNISLKNYLNFGRFSDCQTSYEVIHPQNIITLFVEHYTGNESNVTISTLNIFTGKLLQQYQLKGYMHRSGAKYFSALNLLVVPVDRELIVYEVINQLGGLKLAFAHVFLEQGERSDRARIHYSGNMILVVIGDGNYRPNDPQRNKFRIYQLTQQGIKQHVVDIRAKMMMEDY